MKKGTIFLGFLAIALAVSIMAAPAVFAEEGAAEPATASAPALTIDRMVVAANIVDREPVGAADTFSADTAKVYCFIEAKDIKEETSVNFVWYFHGNEMAKVAMKIGAGDRWRTYTSKNLGGLKGSWKVEIQDANEVILKIAEFKVQ